MDLNKLTLGDKLAAGGALLFVIFAIIFDWHRVCFAGFCTGLSVFSGDGEAIPVLGFLAFILALAVLALVLLPKLFDVKLPDLPVPLNDAIFYAAVGTVALLVLKLIFKFDFIGFGAWLMIIAAAVSAYGGFLVKQGGSAAATDTGSTGTAPF